MKLFFPIILLILLLFCISNVYCQMLVNFKPDSLQEIDKFYYSHIDKNNKLMLQEGEYFLIFDINVNTDSVKLTIKGENNIVIPFDRYDGLYRFYLPKFEVTTFLISYDLDGKNLLAKLYKKPANIIGSELNEDFQIKDIFNNKFNKSNLTGHQCIFLVSDDTRLFDVIQSVKEDYKGDSIIIIAMAGRVAKNILEFKNRNNYHNIIFSSSGMLSLYPWVREFNRPITNVVYISDKHLALKYRHIIDNSFITDQNLKFLKEDIKQLIN